MTDTKTCLYCISEIPANAKKCRYCLEWQEEIGIEQATPIAAGNSIIKEENSSIPFQLALVKRVPLHYVVTILLFSAICFGAIQIMWYTIDEDPIYLVTFLIFLIQLIITWSGIIYVYYLFRSNFVRFMNFSSPSGDAEAQYSKYNQLIFNNKICLILGVVIGLAASIGEYINGTPLQTTEGKIIFAFFEFIFMFFVGSGIYPLIQIGLFLFNSTKETVGSNAEFDKKNDISYLGRFHLSTVGLAIVPLFLGIVAKLFGEWVWDPIIILWYSSFGVIILVYIYWPMINIHKYLKIDVDNQLSLIQSRIKSILIEISHNPSSKNFSTLNELRGIEKEIANQPTWPFDTKNLSAAFFAIIFPITLMILDKLLNL